MLSLLIASLVGGVVGLTVGLLVSKAYLIATHYPLGISESSDARVIISVSVILFGFLYSSILG